MTADWASRLAAGSVGGLVEVGTLPSGGDLATIDPAMARIVVLEAPTSKTAFIGALAAGLDAPAWFGRNWDALDELLRSPASGPDLAIVVLWHHPERLPASDRATAVALLRAAADDRRVSGMRPLLVLVAPPIGTSRLETAAMSSSADAVPDAIRRIGRIHHVALIVRSIEEARRLWQDQLGLHLESVMDIAHDRVRIAFLAVGGSKIELVEPTDDTTGVARFLASKGEGFHHVCLEVPDLAAALEELRQDGIELIDAAPRRGAEGPVAFLHPRSCHGVLVELIEAAGGPAWTSLGFPPP